MNFIKILLQQAGLRIRLIKVSVYDSCVTVAIENRLVKKKLTKEIEEKNLATAPLKNVHILETTPGELEFESEMLVPILPNICLLSKLNSSSWSNSATVTFLKVDLVEYAYISAEKIFLFVSLKGPYACNTLISYAKQLVFNTV
ncbi:hypothetical protein BpHYR1_012381 [Brachionus plicatilis]|uniref:Uncharacterized protein n=1 Tax=Brachionus plicatilis TaxID=10195 RepID=A0A3M7RUQ4_BRAPC|nr:hypothetical protein BpHYR1_012381 [Brachionus plicatilis]